MSKILQTDAPSNMEKKKISLSQFMKNLNRTYNDMTIRTFHFNPIQVNTFILHDETGDAIIVDPGNCASYEDEQLKEYILQHNLLVKYIINTHPHIDHVAGNPWCANEYHVPVCMHEAGLPIYDKAYAYGAAFGILVDSMPHPSMLLMDGEILHYGNQELQVFYTPGHCDGSICLYDKKNKFVISGDLIFEGSVGRSDLPTGDPYLLIKSIQDSILTLDDDVVIYPGHGDTTTIGNERLHNPYLQQY
ncbi:MAG: MBL fold metallo-hydrolase [Bacteroidales bacterium]|nr:MBL fold metallo-hydrolase [Bacteroidales bacterium]